MRGVGDQKAAARGIVDREAGRVGAAEEVADRLGDLPGGEGAVGVGEVELVLVRPVERRAELPRQSADLVGGDGGEVEVHPVEGIRGQILGAAVGVEDTPGEGELLARGPHAEDGPGGGVVEVRRDRIFVESEVGEIKLVAVAEERLVGDEDVADLADEEARLFAQALDEERLAGEHRRRGERVGEEEAGVGRHGRGGVEGLLWIAAVAGLGGEVDQAAVPQPGPAGVDVDRHLRVLDEPIPRIEAPRHDVLIGAGRVDVEEHAAAGEVGPPSPPVACQLRPLPEAAGDGAGEAEDGAVVEERIEDRRCVGQRQAVGWHRPPVIGRDRRSGRRCGRRRPLAPFIEIAEAVEIAPLAAGSVGGYRESGEPQEEPGEPCPAPGRVQTRLAHRPITDPRSPSHGVWPPALNRQNRCKRFFRQGLTGEVRECRRNRHPLASPPSFPCGGMASAAFSITTAFGLGSGRSWRRLSRSPSRDSWPGPRGSGQTGRGGAVEVYKSKMNQRNACVSSKTCINPPRNRRESPPAGPRKTPVAR